MIIKTTPTAYRNNNNNIIDAVTREVREKAPCDDYDRCTRIYHVTHTRVV